MFRKLGVFQSQLASVRRCFHIREAGCFFFHWKLMFFFVGSLAKERVLLRGGVIGHQKSTDGPIQLMATAPGLLCDFVVCSMDLT